ncbi:hypothetical protein [Niveibacterium sp.]|uniref:hypothetical protein n=1 Tax=Niveibacterium sp. TaxID=2017444 RepID=UPI0035AF306B
MASSTTLIQAQQRYIDRCLTAHPGHVRRVANAAAGELKAWATKRGYDPAAVHRDAKDMLELERASDD